MSLKIRQSRQFWPVVSLLFLFAFSIFIRAGWFNLDYIKDGHWTQYDRFTNTEVYIHLGYVFHVYDFYPARDHKFASYIDNRARDQFLAHKGLPLTVYTSFPPTLFVVPYLTFTLLHIVPSFLAMQWFGLSIQLICVLLIYYLSWLLTKNKLVSVVGASIYIFSTGTLQNHMNVYWAHELLQPFFIASLILFVKRKGLLKWWESLLIGFVLSVITWTGAVATVGYLLYGGYKFIQTRNKAYLSYLYALGGMVLALLLIASQVLVVTGASIPIYLHALSHRASVRSVVVDYIPVPKLIWQFIEGLFLDYGGYIFIAYTLALVRKLQDFEWAVVFIAAFPIAESFALLAHDTTYGFGRLKWLLPVILLICMLGNKFATTRKNKAILIIIVALANILHIWLFSVIYAI